MKTSRILAAGLTAIAIATSVPAQSQTSPGTRHKTEFALLESVNLVSLGEGGVLSYGKNDNATAVTFPTMSPGIRMTFWSKSTFTFDFGMSLMHLSRSTGYGSDKFTALQLEGGPGLDLATAGATFRPFVGMIGGVFSAGGSGDNKTEGYVGGQVGFRKFVREYAATRLQLAYRKTMGDYFKVGFVEIAGGVSFFL